MHYAIGFAAWLAKNYALCIMNYALLLWTNN